MWSFKQKGKVWDVIRVGDLNITVLYAPLSRLIKEKQLLTGRCHKVKREHLHNGTHTHTHTPFFLHAHSDKNERGERISLKTWTKDSLSV